MTDTQQQPEKQYLEADQQIREGETTIRVNISLLDSLMNLAGELVLSRNQLLQTISVNNLKSAEGVGQRIDLITSELQEAIMLTRMQPIGNVFNRFPDIVGRLAEQHEKNVTLEIRGKEVEVDKTIIELINKPLEKLVRSAVINGIEVPQERRRKSKKETGRITLNAIQEAGQVVIDIVDDGKGVDIEGLVSRAVRKGLITTEQSLAMSEKEKLDLLFLIDQDDQQETEAQETLFTGMGAVKDSLDKLGGQIDIQSEPDKNTWISIKLPLTLAIIPCQVIGTEGEQYAIPQVNLEELLRIPAHQVKEKIEIVGSAEVVRLRGKLLPLVRLADVLGIERTYVDGRDGTIQNDRRQRIADRRSRRLDEEERNQDSEKTGNEDSMQLRLSEQDRRNAPESALNIVVVTSGSMSYGLIVDHLQDSEEIVLKPLGRHLQECRGYAGATIMGDGRIALILDVNNLAELADLTAVDTSEYTGASDLEGPVSSVGDSRSMLIFSSGEDERFAISLDQVERIEKIKHSDIENLGHKRVMQYRDGSLTLICIDDVAGVTPLADREDLLVIVFSVGMKLVGLLACGPVDTREVDVEIDKTTLRQTGIAGSLIVDGQTTLCVDIDEMVEQLFPE
ncbi:chemotaxis protein CheW [Desulfopila sp. IMCC35008]|uniref:chemotaxis protein CheW n=1 Tax=Desulfopila sp. IMCC35008 TaxID=2653858 RepID=UPI001F118E5A|nr:chemotaxis protein CheW [Desulfopila sp. IMCC35008]